MHEENFGEKPQVVPLIKSWILEEVYTWQWQMLVICIKHSLFPSGIVKVIPKPFTPTHSLDCLFIDGIRWTLVRMRLFLYPIHSRSVERVSKRKWTVVFLVLLLPRVYPEVPPNSLNVPRWVPGLDTGNALAWFVLSRASGVTHSHAPQGVESLFSYFTQILGGRFSWRGDLSVVPRLCEKRRFMSTFIGRKSVSQAVSSPSPKRPKHYQVYLSCTAKFRLSLW